jgi:hypothetical protein
LAFPRSKEVPFGYFTGCYGIDDMTHRKNEIDDKHDGLPFQNGGFP